MTAIHNPDLELALLPKSVFMFSELIERLHGDDTLAPTRRRDMVSGLTRVAAALGREVGNVPADPGWLQPRLEAVAPAKLDITPKSWANVVSNAKAAMAHAGIVAKRINRPQDLSPEWRALWDEVLADRQARPGASLGPFVYFLNRMQIAPADVTDAHAQDFKAALAANEIRRNPEIAYKNAICVWNAAAREIPGWPSRHLHMPVKRRLIKLPLDTFPASFRQDLEAFCTELANPDVFAQDDRKPMRESSIYHYRRTIERFAGALVRSGMPAEKITSLCVLVAPEAAEQGLRWLYAHHNRITPGLTQMASCLVLVAHRHCRLDSETIAQIKRLEARLTDRQKPKGLSSKNRERLRPLLAPETRRRLLNLPEQLFKRAANDRSHSMCLLREQALVIAILCYAPIRRQNLLSIEMERHLQRGGKQTFLVFKPGEVKNRQHIEFPLPDHVVTMIDRHVSLRSPSLCPPGTPWLFAKRDGSGPARPDDLAKQVKQRIRKEIGYDMNLHLFRHWAAFLYLEAQPGNYEAVRRLLGHCGLGKALDYYVGSETLMVSQQFGDILDRERQP